MSRSNLKSMPLRAKTLTVCFSAFLAGYATDVRADTISYATAGPAAYGAAACANPIVRTVNVPDSFAITDVDVLFRASHLWRTDTNLSVTSPTGTVVDLLTGNYAASLDNYNVIFDDEAAVVVDTGAHAVNQVTIGPATPVNSEGDPLSDFDGEDAAGLWTFRICDVYTPADPGSVVDLELILEVHPDLSVQKTVGVYSAGGYALPGSDVVYTFSLVNAGLGSVDADSILLIDTLPGEIEFYNGDMDGAGTLTTDAVAFSQSGAGLTFTYATDVGFSNAAARPATFADCNYTPTAGYDPNLRHVCINPKGAFAAGNPDPTAQFQFRVRIK